MGSGANLGETVLYLDRKAEALRNRIGRLDAAHIRGADYVRSLPKHAAVCEGRGQLFCSDLAGRREVWVVAAPVASLAEPASIGVGTIVDSCAVTCDEDVLGHMMIRPAAISQAPIGSLRPAARDWP